MRDLSQRGLATVGGEHEAQQAAVVLPGDVALGLQRGQLGGRHLEAGVADDCVKLGQAQPVAHAEGGQDEKGRFVQRMAGQQLAQGKQQLIVGPAQQVAQQVFGIAALRRRGGPQAHFLARLAGGNCILAGLVDQGRQVAAVIGKHLADEDHVVPAVVPECRAALKTGRALGEQGGRADSHVQRQPGKFVASLRGETTRQALLVGGQHMHVPVQALLEDRQAPGRLGQAPEHKRRIEGHRVETVGGNPDGRVVSGTRGDDGHPGREGAEGCPEGLGVKAGLGHVMPRWGSGS